MKRLVLLGGGHAHVKVLADLAEQPLAGWEVHLVAPYRRQIYSGMLPGWVAGHYPIEACAIRLDALARRARVAFHGTAGRGLDLHCNTVQCADGSTLRFDALSIDTGPMPALQDLPGSAEHALPVRPIEQFIAAWPALVERIRRPCRRFDLVVLGAGASGVELAFAIQRRATTEGWSHLVITVLGSDALPLPGAPLATRRRAARLLARRGIAWKGDCRATRLEAGEMHVEGGPPLRFDVCIASTGAAAPAWTVASGLATDARGFIQVSRSLQSASHPNVFAAGDVASYADERPKSGVFAVRAGPVLAKNLRAFCAGQAMQPWTPQSHALYLISTGERHALATWGRWSWSGCWVWRWKDRIDRQFMRRFGTEADGSPRP
ncbi:MAG: FAD-dependent oxidoreductase [Burkholderiales bacterium]|nr:FAD-dependent oxidoreductase [Burkholderiales bacterium]